ncbi:ATP-dependent 6-phosphofructokinase 7 [Glycine soja]
MTTVRAREIALNHREQGLQAEPASSESGRARVAGKRVGARVARESGVASPRNTPSFPSLHQPWFSAASPPALPPQHAVNPRIRTLVAIVVHTQETRLSLWVPVITVTGFSYGRSPSASSLAARCPSASSALISFLSETHVFRRRQHGGDRVEVIATEIRTYLRPKLWMKTDPRPTMEGPRENSVRKAARNPITPRNLITFSVERRFPCPQNEGPLSSACIRKPSELKPNVSLSGVKVVTDSSFGFDIAVEEAQGAINFAHVEAESTENGIDIVKLMGRYSGYRRIGYWSSYSDLSLITPEKLHAEPANRSI